MTGFEQFIQQINLLGSHFTNQEVGDGIEIGTMFQKKSSSLKIPRSGPGKKQMPGVFVETEHHHGRFIRRRHNFFFQKQLRHDRGCCANLFDTLKRPDNRIFIAGVVIVDMNFKTRLVDNFGKVADAGCAAHIDQNQAGHLLQIDIADPFDIIGVKGGLQQKISQPTFLTTGKNQLRIGIEPLGSNHGPEAVEIGIDVGSNNIHNRAPVKPPAFLSSH